MVTFSSPPTNGQTDDAVHEPSAFSQEEGFHFDVTQNALSSISHAARSAMSFILNTRFVPDHSLEANIDRPQHSGGFEGTRDTITKTLIVPRPASVNTFRGSKPLSLLWGLASALRRSDVHRTAFSDHLAQDERPILADFCALHEDVSGAYRVLSHGLCLRTVSASLWYAQIHAKLLIS